MARSWLIVYLCLAELQTNCHLRTGCGIVPSLSRYRRSIYLERHLKSMVNDTRYGSAHAASRRKSWVRQNLLLLPPKRLFAMRFSSSVTLRALFWLFKHSANLMASNSGPLFYVCAYEMNLRQKPRFSPSTCRRLLRQAAYRDAPHRSEPIHLFTPSHETRIHFRHAAARPI
jgi:hypothetical protein